MHSCVANIFVILAMSHLSTGSSPISQASDAFLDSLVQRYTAIVDDTPADDASLSRQLHESMLRVLQMLMPSGTEKQIAFGIATGCLSGFVAMRVGKAAALIIGMGVIMLQLFHYYGFVEIDWSRVHRRLASRGRQFVRRSTAVMELNVLTIEDFMQRNRNISAGFMAGFMLGLAFG